MRTRTALALLAVSLFLLGTEGSSISTADASGQVGRKSGPAEVRIISLEHSKAGELAGLLRGLVGGTRIIADSRSNMLIVHAAPSEFETIAAVVSALDVEGEPAPPYRKSALVRLETKVLRVRESALEKSGIRLSSIQHGSASRTPDEEIMRLLERADGTDGVSLIADLTYTVRAGRKIRFGSDVAYPTTTTSLSGSGVSMQGFSGYEKGGISFAFEAAPVAGKRVLVDVQFRISDVIGEGEQGLPPAKSNRDGEFSAVIPDGETEVLGGMIRMSHASEYLLFFLKPTLVE